MLSGAAANSPSHALVYPVVYLQHGGGEDKTGWIRQGNANFILDNLIASDASKPIIIVMANGYASARVKPLLIWPANPSCLA